MLGKKITNDEIEKALDKLIVEDKYLVMGFEKTSDARYQHRIFKDTIEGHNLTNPVFSVNGARYLRRLFAKDAKIILMMRPCEVRAYIELVKLTQVDPQDIIAVSIDCFGTVSSKTDDAPPEGDELKSLANDAGRARYACSNCRERRGVVGAAGIRIDKAGNYWAFSYTDKGQAFAAMLEGSEEEAPAAMEIAAGEAKLKFQVDMKEFAKDFSKCIMCMNCRDMCPVCYCVDCVFSGDEYLPKGDALLNKVMRSGSTEIPRGKELFHLIRMYHVSQTCVGCGACEEACPQGIPLTKYFKGVSERLQGLFSYMSGRSFDETIPYVTFKEEELKDAED